MRDIAHILPALLLLMGIQAPALAAPKYLVTLRSGFVMEASHAENASGEIVLRVNQGEIRFAVAEIERIELLPSADGLSTAEQQIASGAQRTGPADGGSPMPDVAELIREAAQRHGLPESFVRSVAEAESALQPNAVSPKGARGVMQLMPGTAELLGVDPNDPAENVEGGAKLLRALLLQYQNDPDQVRKALAAYNAGSGAVTKYGGVPTYRETQEYVERVLQRYHRKNAVVAGQ